MFRNSSSTSNSNSNSRPCTIDSRHHYLRDSISHLSRSQIMIPNNMYRMRLQAMDIQSQHDQRTPRIAPLCRRRPRHTFHQVLLRQRIHKAPHLQISTAQAQTHTMRILFMATSNFSNRPRMTLPKGTDLLPYLLRLQRSLFIGNKSRCLPEKTMMSMF